MEVPYCGQQVAVRDQRRKLPEAAFFSLAQQWYISLRVDETNTLFLHREALTAGQEKSIMDALSRATQRPRLMTLIARVAKAEERLLGGKGYYCDGVALVVMKALTDMGWLRRGGPVKQAASLLAAMAGHVQTVSGRLDNFAAQNPDLHARLVGELMQLA